MEQQAVLSPPAQPRQQGGADLWDGGIVGERFKAVVWKLLSQRLTEALKIFPGNQVVVGHHRIAGDVALRVLPRIVGEQADQHRLRVLRQPLFGPAFQQGRQVRKPADAKGIGFPPLQNLSGQAPHHFLFLHLPSSFCKFLFLYFITFRALPQPAEKRLCRKAQFVLFMRQNLCYNTCRLLLTSNSTTGGI